MERNRLFLSLFQKRKEKNMKVGDKVKTPVKCLVDAEIIQINGNLATVKGYQIKEKFMEKQKIETKRVFPLTALRENEYSKKLFLKKTVSEQESAGTESKLRKPFLIRKSFTCMRNMSKGESICPLNIRESLYGAKSRSRNT